MHLTHSHWFGAMIASACAFLILPRSVVAKASDDPFSAMRIRRVAPPVRPSQLILHGTDGTPIRLSDYRGKAVLVEFLMTY